VRPTDVLFSLAGTLAAGALVPVAYMASQKLRERARRAADAVRADRLREARERLDAAAARAELSELSPVSVDQILDSLSSESTSDAQQKWLVQVASDVGALERFCERARKGATWNDRAFAVRLLGRLSAPAAATVLSEVVRDRTEDEVVRTLAADALAAIRDPAVIPLLVGELRVADEKSTPRAAEALIRFGSLATPHLIEALTGKEQGSARLWAARILTATRDVAALDALLSALRDRLDLVRVASAAALGNIGDPRALAPLMQAALRDPAPLARSQAAVAAAQLSGEEAANVLLSALRDPDYATRLRALEAFESMQLENLTPLEMALSDDNVEVQRRAALALERSGYLDRLMEQLAAPERAQRTAAYAKLLQLGRAGLTESITGRLRHEQMGVRVAIARACAELRAVRAGPGLIAALDDPAWPVRAAACEAIEQLRPNGAGPALLGLLADPEESVREAAASALTGYAPSESEASSDQLRMAYDNGSVPIRLAVLSLLAGRSGAAQPLLIEALRDPSEAVRLRAVGALSRHPDPSATPALIAALTDRCSRYTRGLRSVARRVGRCVARASGAHRRSAIERRSQAPLA
jgi:HEAT repeat protein